MLFIALNALKYWHLSLSLLLLNIFHNALAKLYNYKNVSSWHGRSQQIYQLLFFDSTTCLFFWHHLKATEQISLQPSWASDFSWNSRNIPFFWNYQNLLSDIFYCSVLFWMSTIKHLVCSIGTLSGFHALIKGLIISVISKSVPFCTIWTVEAFASDTTAFWH